MNNEDMLNAIEVLSRYNEKAKWSKKLCFDWKNITEKYVQIKENSKIYEWLVPIKFCTIYALIIEALLYNIDDIFKNREESIEIICDALKMDMDYFYKSIEEIQRIFIKFRKVKVCNDGSVIIMNEF